MNNFIKLNIWSGLCNQLLPLVSCIYFGKKYNKKVIFNSKSLWVCELNTTKFFLSDFFKFPEICEERKVLLDKKDCSYHIQTTRNNYVNQIKTIQLNDNKNIYISNVVHLIGTENDETHLYNPQPTKNIKKTPYLLEIQKILKNIDLIDEIKKKIKETTDIIDDNVIGIHFRSRDGGFTVNNKYKLENFINKLSSNKKIYLSSDDHNTEQYIKDKFKERIITMKNPFGGNIINKTNNSKHSIMNGICEIYILSKCNEFYGTKSSSFTFTSWLLSDNKILNFWN
jgi:hypothetical protein